MAEPAFVCLYVNKPRNCKDCPESMKIFHMDGKIKLLCLVYFMVAQKDSMMAQATSDSFLLSKDINFQQESIPLMIMAAASLSIVLAIFTTYLCGRFQAFGAMRIATAEVDSEAWLGSLLGLPVRQQRRDEDHSILATCFARSSSFCPWFFFGEWRWAFLTRRNQRNGWA